MTWGPPPLEPETGDDARRVAPPPAPVRVRWQDRPRVAWRWWWGARWRRALSWLVLTVGVVWNVGVWWILQDPRFTRISEEGWRRMDWQQIRLVWALQDSALAAAVQDSLRQSGLAPTPPPAGLAALAARWGGAVQERHPYLFLTQTVDESGILYVVVDTTAWNTFPPDDRLLITGELGMGWRRYLEEHLGEPVTGLGAPGVIVLGPTGRMLARDLDETVALVGPRPASDTVPP